MSEPKFSKFKDGKTYQEERRDRRVEIETAEKESKAQARRRDGNCRWPGCDCERRRINGETAHLDAKGLGGDHGNRSGASNLVRLCPPRHTGPRSLHSGHLKIDVLTREGADGPLSFWRRDSLSEPWTMVAIEDAPGAVRRD